MRTASFFAEERRECGVLAIDWRIRIGSKDSVIQFVRGRREGMSRGGTRTREQVAQMIRTKAGK